MALLGEITCLFTVFLSLFPPHLLSLCAPAWEESSYYETDMFYLITRATPTATFYSFQWLLSDFPLASRDSPILTCVSSLSFTLSHCHVTVSLSQSVAVSNPKQVQLIHSKNASTPTSPTSPTSPAGPAGGAATWTDNKGADKGQTLLAANPEAGKDLFNMKP